MKLFTATAAALLALAGPAQAQNFNQINNTQAAILEVLSWSSAGNVDESCAALAKAEAAAVNLNDEVALEAGVKAQALTQRSFLLRMNIFCPLSGY